MKFTFTNVAIGVAIAAVAYFVIEKAVNNGGQAAASAAPSDIEGAVAGQAESFLGSIWGGVESVFGAASDVSQQ